jgi:hypothetical protein
VAYLSADEHQIRRRWTSSQSKVARAIASAPLPYPKVIFCRVRVDARGRVGGKGRLGLRVVRSDCSEGTISVKKDELERNEERVHTDDILSVLAVTPNFVEVVGGSGYGLDLLVLG